MSAENPINDPIAVEREIEAELLRDLLARAGLDALIFRSFIYGILVGMFSAAVIIVPIMLLI